MTSDIAHKPRTKLIIQPAKGWSALAFGELWSYRDLLYILALRDVKLRYKQTALGIAWVVLQPLVAAMIFAVIFGRLAGLPSGDRPYILFVFAGLLPWNLFSGALQRAGNSLVNDSRLISKIYFPRMAIPISSSAAVLIDFGVMFIIMLGLIAFFQLPLTWNILALPCFLLLAMLISIGVSLYISALNVYYRDFMYALPFLIQVWMYASPLVYSSDLIPESFRAFYALNPMVGIIEGFRWSLLGGDSFPLVSVGVALLISVFIFFSGAFVFQRVERSFADVI